MELQNTINRIKKDLEEAIITATFNGKSYRNGQEAKTALIRSSNIINLIHDQVKYEFIRNGISEGLIFPRLKQRKGEIPLRGFFKYKKQDICIIPNEIEKLRLEKSFDRSDEIISINVRSQLSSIDKNTDTLHERTIAEALNLHLLNNKQCLGDVYLIPVHEYLDQAAVSNRIEFKNKITKLESYIQLFQFLNLRKTVTGEDYKYERICLLIVDFQHEIPKIYNSKDELLEDKLIGENSDIDFNSLNFDTFASDILEEYRNRFNTFPS